jgi:subtilisin family serine protease
MSTRDLFRVTGRRTTRRSSARPRGRIAGWVAVAAATLVVVALTPAPALAQAPSKAPDPGSAATTDPLSKVDKAVTDNITQHGAGTFFIQLNTEAELSTTAPGSAAKRAQRTAEVYHSKVDHANTTQAGLRSLLKARGVEFTPFWIVNVIKVTGTAALLKEIAARPEVAKIVPERLHAIPAPTQGKTEAEVNSVEWNINQIRANQVWSDFGVTGQNIVVASIDTGVQYTHPALVGKYRGNNGDGTFNHNYNWYDPSNVCGNPSVAPCDNADHGTHTMGTMVGDDGAGNQVGVAPGAKWISAKGCESSNCSDSALLSSGQWVVAPTDLNGQNPRPDLAPNIVNNSWGGGEDDTWYQETVDTWIAAGIFPAFSNGNSGAQGCDSANSPGDYPETYSAGAYDSSGNIASFSSRGPGFGTAIKPNIAAPGVNVRSSVPGGYDSFSGTSMASPHVAGTVALLWSAAPALVGDIATTRQLLDASAVDIDNTSCGGTAANNNVFGQGKLDAYAAVAAAPRGPTGSLTGTVTSGGSPLEGATVAIDGPFHASRTTGADGTFSLAQVSVGDYTVTASKFGYVTSSATVSVTEGGTATVTVNVAAASSFAISGTVRDTAGAVVAGATVSVAGTPIAAATTNASGGYAFGTVPAGEYDVTADYGRWLQPLTQHVVVDGAQTLDFALPAKTDAYGYTAARATPSFVDTPTVLALTGDDSTTNVSLPFPVTFYGKTYATGTVSTNGFLALAGADATPDNTEIPDSAAPNAAIYGFWDDLFADSASSIRSAVTGTAPNRKFVVEWRNLGFYQDLEHRVTFQIVISEFGAVTVQYKDLDPAQTREIGSSATVGIENELGTVGLEYSADQPYLADDTAISFSVPNSGLVRGTVTDANDGGKIAGGTVTVHSGSITRSGNTDAAGFYQVQVPLGSFTLVASASAYTSARANLYLGEESVLTRDFALATPRIEVSPAALEVVVPPGEQRTSTITVKNTGSATANWQVKEVDGGSAASAASTLKASALAKDAKPDARTSESLHLTSAAGVNAAKAVAANQPEATGDVLKSWPINELTGGWGAGYNSSVWVSDASGLANAQYGVDGGYVTKFSTAFGGWPADLAYVPARKQLCQVTVGGDNAIRCWNPATGAVASTITGPWSSISQRGLAYRADDDTFYIGGWNQGIVYHIKGLSYSDAGAVIGQCTPAGTAISGLAYSPRGVLWVATNASTDTITAVNPDTCQAVASAPDPDPATFSGSGLELDELGNLWVVSQHSGAKSQAYLVDSGIPSFSDVPWLTESSTSGSLAVGKTQDLTITIDASTLTPGVYGATVFVISDSAKKPTIGVPVKVVVPAYRKALDAGASTGGFVDSAGDTWGADQPYSTGGFGYLGLTSTAVATTDPIDGTADQKLYQTAREGAYEYRFDGLASGVYQVELDFAELSWTDPNSRLFDVVLERQLELPGLDIAGEVGGFAALPYTFTVAVTDGALNVRLLTRSGKPLINGVRVTSRPDLVAS